MTIGQRTTCEYLDSCGVGLSRFDIIIEKLLIALLVFMPFAMGAKHAWSEEIVIALSSVIVICFSVKLVCYRREGLIWTWAYVPLVAFLLVVILQLIELPTNILSMLSPNTAMLKTELLGGLGNVGSEIDGLKSMSLSFYPNVTKHDLRLVLAVAGVFVVVLNVFRRPEQIKRLLKAIAVIGGSIALFALMQDLFGNDKVYGVISSAHKAYSGPFTNHSHYGQFMNLSIGAAFAYLCVKLHEDFRGREITLPVVADYFGSASVKPLWLLLGIISLGMATIFVSLTRSGMISMFIAAVFTALLLARRRSLKGYGWIMAVTALAAFICILYIGFDAVYDRLAALSSLDNYHVRWQIIKDLTASYRRFPIFGTGLGTHSVVYPMFQNITTTAVFTHAENEYAQVAEETGVLGLVLLIMFSVIIWSNYAKNIRNAKLPICSAAYGLGFGLLAVLIHSLSDFGQRLPSNAFLSAIFCALLVSLVRQNRREQFAAQAVATGTKWIHSRVLRSVALVIICGISGWSLAGSNNARIGASYWRGALNIEKGLVDNNWRGSDGEYEEIIFCASKALDYQPENITYRYWLNVYRWYELSRMIDPDTGVLPDDSMSRVREIVEEFRKARRYCPTYGATYCTLGQIEKLILGEEAGGAEKIRKGFRLAPNDPIVCLTAGCLDIEEGEIEESFAKLQKAVRLNGKFFNGIVDMYIRDVNRADLAVALAGDNISRLSYVANILTEIEEHEELVVSARTKVLALLKEKCSRPGAPASAFVSLANIYRKQQDNDAAIEYYRLALASDYGQVGWRFTLAKLLVKNGRIPEAMDEAKICLRLRPEFKAAKKLVADLSVHPKILNEERSTP
ncbi:MAG: hypothetical protein FVQ80_04860 [Planctomycetes bacterium]|nr:hypothetical protein [Planctomycetota bacterium]